MINKDIIGDEKDQGNSHLKTTKSSVYRMENTG